METVHFFYPYALGLARDEKTARAISSARVFVLDGKLWDHFSQAGTTRRFVDQDVNLERLSLPFPICYVELAGDNVFFVGDDLAGPCLKQSFVMFVEKSPYEVTLVSDLVRDGVTIDLRKPIDQQGDIEESAMAMFYLDVFCRYLASCQVGYEKVYKNYPVQIGHHKQTATLSRIIRLAPSDQAKVQMAPVMSRTIEWESAWFVRGHWRAKPGGVGKDRAGDYKVQGYTWVVPHRKGNKVAEPVKKVYTGLTLSV